MKTDQAYLKELTSESRVKQPKKLISSWVQDHRIMPPGTPYPGPWKNEKTPYLIEPMDNMSPFSPVVYTSIMKGAQLGFTAAAENIEGYWMEEIPAEILHVSATEKLLEKWSNKRLDALIKSIGFGDKIQAVINDAKSRKTGDKVFSKTFPGGALDMASAQSASDLRMDSKRICIIDEMDGAPLRLRTGEGSFNRVAYARTLAWGNRKKIFEFSTPTTFEKSLIYKRYLMGDQRKFHVPCPHCHTYQELKFKNLVPEIDEDGILKVVYYKCSNEDCGELWSNYDKRKILPLGVWKATAVPKSVNHRSYHISSLYSPFGMLSWTELYQEYLNAKNDPDPEEAMRSFVNLYLGKPYRTLGSRPDVNQVLENRGQYFEGDIPYGVLFLTMSVDVQTGSKTDPNNPERLELEVKGHGRDYRTWSILHKVFEGSVTDAYSGAWEDMNDWAEEGGLIFKRDDGMNFVPEMCVIDSSDGNIAPVVYQFCNRWQNTIAIQGTRALSKKSMEGIDEATRSDIKKYQISRSKKSGDNQFISVYTVHYKNMIYNNLKIKRGELGENPPAFCDFPADRPDKYFLTLTAEEKDVNGNFHAKGRRNEGLDLMVYNLCAADVWLMQKVNDMRLVARMNGANEFQYMRLGFKDILNQLEHERARLK